VADQVSPIRLVAGLGNPGSEYQFTRHNVGFLVLDLLAARNNATWENSKKWSALWTRLGDVYLVKPTTYMNHSGETVAAVADFYKVAPNETLVVADDTALPVGRLRIRQMGGSGGHNGLSSVIMHLATDAFPRLRIGIGAPPPQGSTDYVLGNFFEEEKPIMEAAIKRAADAVKWAIDNGLLSAMNTFNPEPVREGEN
jgi:PTH1 family peptidyl-tRNA hydrolase